MDVSGVQPWRRAAEVAARQHGIVTTSDLAACGIGRSGIEKGVKAGRLWRVHVGVYALGHPLLGREGRWHAAVVACRDGVLSHRPAGVAWRVYRGELSRVEVTVPRRGTYRRPGVLIHTISTRPQDEITEWNGIPITTPSRTAVDLAHELRDHDLIHGMLRQLQYRRFFDAEKVAAANARRPNAVLTQVLADLRPTESPLEDAFRTRSSAATRSSSPTSRLASKACAWTSGGPPPASPSRSTAITTSTRRCCRRTRRATTCSAWRATSS